MKHTLTLISTLLFVSLGTLCGADRPNVIFILADDAGIGDFSAYGCKYGSTPNIDHLATEGMKFTRAYSGSAVCAPSRGVLMTGQHTGHALRRANQSKIGLLSLPPDQTSIHYDAPDQSNAGGAKANKQASLSESSNEETKPKGNRK